MKPKNEGYDRDYDPYTDDTDYTDMGYTIGDVQYKPTGQIRMYDETEGGNPVYTFNLDDAVYKKPKYKKWLFQSSHHFMVPANEDEDVTFSVFPAYGPYGHGELRKDKKGLDISRLIYTNSTDPQSINSKRENNYYWQRSRHGDIDKEIKRVEGDFQFIPVDASPPPAVVASPTPAVVASPTPAVVASPPPTQYTSYEGARCTQDAIMRNTNGKYAHTVKDISKCEEICNADQGCAGFNSWNNGTRCAFQGYKCSKTSPTWGTYYEKL